METITVKVKSFQYGGLNSIVNAQMELLAIPISRLKSQIKADYLQQIPQSIFRYSYTNLKARLAPVGYNGQSVEMFLKIYGIADLTESEIKELANYNLAIVGIRGKMY
jgi:hypothetical protein